MATPGGKKPNKQQAVNAGNEIGLDLANAIGKAINRTLSTYDFSPIGKSLSKSIGKIDIAALLKTDDAKVKQLAVNAKATLEKGIGNLKIATEVDTSLVNTEFSKLKIADLQALVTEVDTSLIGEEISKLNPLALQAKLTELDSSTISNIPQASVTGNLEVDTTTVQNQIDNISPVSLNNSINELVDTFKNLGKTIKDSIGTNTFAPVTAGARGARRASIDLGASYSQIVDSTKDLIKQTELSNQVARNSAVLGKDRAGAYATYLALNKEELVLAAELLGIEKAESMGQAQLAKIVADKLDKLEETRELNQFIASSYDDMSRGVKQVEADIKLKNVMIKTGLTGEYAENARLKQLQLEQGLISEKEYATALSKLKTEHHIYEERAKQLELTEALAQWQLGMNEELEEYEKGWEKIKSKVKAIITDPKLSATVFAAEGIKTVTEGFKKFGEGFEKMKEQGLSAGQAATAQMKTMSAMSVLGLSDTQGVMEQVIESYGNVNALSRSQVDNIGQMAHHMGITGQEAMKVNETLSQMGGETTESAIEAMHFTENLAKASGVAPGKIMKDIAKNSAAVALYSKDGAKGFGKAAVELHKMGVEISTAAKMADGLLDFENSINKQMEASVLLGREINLDKAREMALAGDLEGATRETLANIGGAAEFTKMNVIQKKALAEAAGMTVEEMQKALDAEEEQQKYHGEEAGFWMNTIGYVTEYGTKLGGFLKEHGMLMLSGLNTLSNQESRQFLINGLQKGYNLLASIGSGIMKGGLSVVRMIFGEKAAGYLKDKAQWALEKAHYAWLKTQAFFGSDKAKAKLADMAKDKLASGVTDKAKDMATDKAKDLAGDRVKDLAGDKAGDLADKAADKGTEKLTGVAEDKAGDLAGKATEGADKLGESGEKVGKKGMTEGFKDNMTNIAEGFKQMGQAGVLKGIFNTAVAGPALVVALPAIPFLLFMGKVALNQLATNFTNLASGLTAMGGTFAGSAALGVFAIASIPSIAAIPFLLFMGLTPLAQLATNFTNLATGLTAMSGTFAGSAALAVFGLAAIPSVLSIPFLLFMGLTPLAQLATNFTNLAAGLTAMSGTFAGSAALAVFGVAAIPAVASIPFLTFVGLVPLTQLASNFTNLAAGLTAMTATMAGSGALAVFGLAAIPAVASIPFLLFMGLTPLKQLTANFTTLAAGLTAMSGTFAGSAALGVFGLAAIPAVASIPFLAFMGVFPLKQLASNFANLAIGLTLMGSATAGAATLGVFALSALAAVGSIPFLTFMGLIPLSQLATNFTSLSAGLIALNSAVVGAADLGVFAISATAAIGSIPFLTFMGFVPLPQLLPNFTALSSGLMAMSATILGSAALLLFAVAGAAAIPSLVFLGGISLLGAPAAAGLTALAGGLAAFGNPATALFVLTGIGLLAALGVAMIPFAAALAIATPAIKVFGDIIIGVFQQIPPIIAAVAAGFVTIFGALAANWQILIPVGIGLGAVAIGLGALGGAALLAFPGLLLASIGLSMMQAPLAMINAVAQTDAIPKLAQSFTMLAALGPGLLVFSISLGALGAAGMLAFPGLVLAGAGLLAMAPGLMAVGAIAQTGAITTLSQSLTGLGSAAGGLALVSASLFGIAGGLGAIAIAGFAAMPIIGALAGLATVAPMLAGLGSLFGGGGGGGEQQTTTQTNTTAAPAEDGKMDILISEIRSLKDIMSKGGVINMDGKKVGDVVRLAMNTSGVR